MIRLSDVTIIFALVALTLFLTLSIKSEGLQKIAVAQTDISKKLDTAVEDAMKGTIKFDVEGNFTINIEACLDNFMSNLYASFDVIDDPLAQVKLLGYIPAIAVIDYDGFYVISQERVMVNGCGELKMVPHPKNVWCYDEEKYTFFFSITDFVRIYNKETGESTSGLRSDMQVLFPASNLLSSAETFDEIKGIVIAEALSDELSYHISKHNFVARQYGIDYFFSLPAISKDDWSRAIEDIGMLVFFQGIKVGGKEVFNSFALGGGRVFKANNYYMTADENGLTYHTESCDRVADSYEKYTDRETCARKGAYPCKECRP